MAKTQRRAPSSYQEEQVRLRYEVEPEILEFAGFSGSSCRTRRARER